MGEPDIYTLNADGTKNYMGDGATYSTHSGTKTIQVYSDAPNTSYSWEVSPPNTIVWGYQGGTATFHTNLPGNYLFTVEATNDCESHLMFFSITIEDDYSPNYFAVYPNPTSGILNIENSAANLNQNNSSYTLYDFNGNPVLIGTFSNLTTLDVSSLLKGHYIMKINSGSITSTHHIVVE